MPLPPLKLRAVATEEPIDPGDFDAVYHRFSPYVAAIGLRLLGRDSEVDDLVQDVFVEAHRGLRKLRDPGAVRGWLATVAVRKAYRQLRRRKVRAFFGVARDVSEYEHLADDSLPPDRRALLTTVYAALDDIPAKERIPWALRYIEGESLLDVARICECSLATAKRRIATAHDKIRKVVGDG